MEHTPPRFVRAMDVKEPLLSTKNITAEERRRRLNAQLVAVAYLQMHLPLYPAAWIVKHIRREFVYIILQERSRYIALRVLFIYLSFAFAFPLAFAYTLLGYSCSERVYKVEGREDLVHAHREGCDLQDFLRSPENALLKIGPALFVVSVLLAFVLQACFKQYNYIRMRVMWIAKPALPRLFYNGLGPAQSDHSAWHIYKKFGLEHHWSWFHDSLGSLDLVVSAVALMLTVAMGFVAVGYHAGGLAGASSGAAAGAAMGRLMLFVLNHALGASDCFITYVDEQLHGFQPYKQVMDPDTGMKKEYVQHEVDHAVEVIRAAGSKSKERSDWDGRGLSQLADLMEKEGPQLLRDLIDWLMQHRDSLFCVQNCCFYMFHTGDTYSSDQYSICSLAMMDIPLLLATYFDPEWDVLGKFVKFNGEKWSPCFKLSTVYMGYPRQLLCKRKKSGLWQIAQVDSEAALQELADIDAKPAELV